MYRSLDLLLTSDLIFQLQDVVLEGLDLYLLLLEPVLVGHLRALELLVVLHLGQPVGLPDLVELRPVVHLLLLDEVALPHDLALQVVDHLLLRLVGLPQLVAELDLRHDDGLAEGIFLIWLLLRIALALGGDGDVCLLHDLRLFLLHAWLLGRLTNLILIITTSIGLLLF